MLESARFRVFLIVRKGRDMGSIEAIRFVVNTSWAGFISMDVDLLSAASSRDRGHVS